MKKLLSAFLAITLVFTIMSPISVFAENGPYPFDPDNEDINLSEFSALGLIDAETFDMAVLYPEAEEFDTPDIFAGATYNLETNTLTLNNVKCKTAMLSATEMGDDFKIELIGYNELGGILSEASTRGGSISIFGDGELVLNRIGFFGGIMIEAGETASKLNVAETVKMKLYYGEEVEAPAIYINASTVTDPAELITIGGEISGEMPVVNNYTREIYEQLDAYDLSSNSLEFYDAGFEKDGVLYIGTEIYDDDFEPTGDYYLYSLAYDEEFDFYVATAYADGEAVSADGFTKLVEYDVLYDEANECYVGYTFFADEGDNSYKTVFYPYMTDTFDLCVDENGTKYGFEQYPYEEEDENGNVESGVDTWVYNLTEHPVYGWIAEADWDKDTLDGLTPIKIGEKELAGVTHNSTLVINNGGAVVEPEKIKNITATSTNQGVKISWSADPAAETYRVYRKASGDKKWTRLDTRAADETSFIDKTVRSGKKYTYSVRGCNFVGDGEFNSTGVTHTYYEAPDVSIKTTTKGVYLKWAKVAGATKYRIYRQTSGSSKWTLIDTETGTSFTDKTAKSGKKYYYRVRAAKGDIMSGYNAVSKYFLSAPKLSSVKNASSGVAVSWGKVTGAEGYKVYRKSGSGSYKYIGKTSKTTYTDTTAKSGTTYTYTVKAYKSKTDSAYNSTGLKLKYLAAPKAKTTVYTSSISVSWSKISGAKEYTVYRKASGESKYKKLTTTTKTSYKDTNVKNNKTYSYRIKAVNGKTTSAYKTIKQLFLSAPKLSSVKNDQFSVEFKWAKVSGAEKYKVYRKSGSGDFKLIATTKKTNYTDNSVKNGTVYTYTVKAFKDDATSYYNKTGLKIRFVQSTNIRSVDNVANGVKLSWCPANKADKYYVYRKLDGESTFKQIDVISADKVKKDKFDSCIYIDKDTKNGQVYFYNIKVSYKGTFSDFSSDPGMATTRMAPIDVTSATATSKGIKIKWEKSDYATAYRIFRKERDVDSEYEDYLRIDNGKTTTVLDQNVESGKTYEYGVIAICDKLDGKWGDSTIGGTKSAKAK